MAWMDEHMTQGFSVVWFRAGKTNHELHFWECCMAGRQGFHSDMVLTLAFALADDTKTAWLLQSPGR